MNGLKKMKAAIDRKVLADMAVNDALTFAKLVEMAKKIPITVPAGKK
jgi:ribosomal protein L20